MIAIKTIDVHTMEVVIKPLEALCANLAPAMLILPCWI